MPNITRFNPSRDIATVDPFDDLFENFFRGFFLQPMTLGPRGLGLQLEFRVDVTENEKEYRVFAEIPGVRKEDINVTIDGDEVGSSAEVRREKDVKDDKGNLGAIAFD